MAGRAAGREGAKGSGENTRAYNAPQRGAAGPDGRAPKDGPRRSYPAELTGRDQLGVVAVSRHNAR